MIDLFIEFIIMTIKDIILVREQSLTFFKHILSIISYVLYMTYQELKTITKNRETRILWL